MSSARKTAITAGVFFLITEVTAIAALVLYNPVLKHADYIAGAGADGRVLFGGLLELILAIAVIGTGVTLFPIVKRQNEGLALGYVCGRVIEAAVIIVGVISVVAVVTLRQDTAGATGADASTLATIAQALVAIHDWTFLIGPALVLGVNSLLLASLMYRSGLVPRFIAVLGVVGGPLITASATAVMFGAYEQTSAFGSLTALPVFAWEVSLAIWLITKGFKAAPIVSERASRPALDPRLVAA